MGITSNRVTAGNYKGANIKIEFFGKKLVMITRGLLTKRIELNKKTIERIELIDKSQTVFDFAGMQKAQVGIYFKNGKKSLAIMDSNIYTKLNEVLF